MGKLRKNLWIVLLGTLSAFGPLSMDMYLPALPDLQANLHATQSLAQLSITACLLGLAIGQVFIGPISDRFGRRMPLLIGVIFFMATSFIIAFMNNIWILIGMRFIQGLGGSAGQVLSRSIARDQFSGKPLARFMSILMSINGIFPIIAPIFGGLLVKFTNWQGIFILLGIIGVILVICVAFFLPETLPHKQRVSSMQHAFKELQSLFKERQFMTYVISQGFIMGALFTYIAGSSFVFQGIYHFSAQTFSLVYALNGFGILLGSRLVGRLVDYFSTERILHLALYYGLGVTGLMALSLLLPANPYILMAGLFLMVIGIGGVNTSAIAMDGQGDKAGSASALIGLSMNAIGGLGTPLVGMFNNHSQVPMVLLIFAAELIGNLIFFGVPRLGKQQNNQN